MHYPKSTIAQIRSEPRWLNLCQTAYQKSKIKSGITIPAEHVQHGGEKNNNKDIKAQMIKSALHSIDRTALTNTSATQPHTQGSGDTEEEGWKCCKRQKTRVSAAGWRLLCVKGKLAPDLNNVAA